MAYTPPARNAVNLVLKSGYTPPARTACNLQLMDGGLLTPAVSAQQTQDLPPQVTLSWDYKPGDFNHFASGPAKLQRSDDGGQTWMDVDTDIDLDLSVVDTGVQERFEHRWRTVVPHPVDGTSTGQETVFKTKTRVKGVFKDSQGNPKNGIEVLVYREDTDELLAQGTTANDGTNDGVFDLMLDNNWPYTVYVVAKGDPANGINGGIATGVQA